MKTFIAIIHLLVALLSAAVAADSVHSARRELATKKTINLRRIKLSQPNVVPTSDGVPYSTGIASVQLDYDPYRFGPWKVCIQSNVVGFTPTSLHIFKGKITENGIAKFDFTPLLKDDPAFSGCITVDQSRFNDIKDHMDLYYVYAGVGDSPPPLTKLGIRGQLVQGYNTLVSNGEEVEQDFQAKGNATIRFETAGSRMCIDASIEDDFDPKVAHFHMGDYGKNGVQIANLSKKRVAAGRFLGCGTLSELGVDESQRATLAAKFLANPELYFIQFHGDTEANPDEFKKAIRGQFEKPKY